MSNDLTIDSPQLRHDMIYGIKKFIPPEYEVWELRKAGLFRKEWYMRGVVTNPIGYANQEVVLRCTGIGGTMGFEHLFEKFLVDKPYLKRVSISC